MSSLFFYYLISPFFRFTDLFNASIACVEKSQGFQAAFFCIVNLNFSYLVECQVDFAGAARLACVNLRPESVIMNDYGQAEAS